MMELFSYQLMTMRIIILSKICDEIFGPMNKIGPIIQNKQNAKNDTVNVQEKIMNSFSFIVRHYGK